MKKVLAVLLSVCLMCTLMTCAFASYKSDAVLKFNSDGKFKIMVLADVQDVYPISETTIAFINESLDAVQPDLVVFCGDNIVTSDVGAYKQLLTPLVERNVPFTLVFGNHDDESSVLNKEEQLLEYQKYAGCLAYDAVPELHGCATHNLPILSSDGSKLAFNLWLFDSGDYVYNSNGEEVGYDWVRADQIDWYNNVRDEMTEENGGEVVNSIAFQHIIPQEPTQKIFAPSEIKFDDKTYDISLGDLTINFEDGSASTFIPNINNFDGFIFEKSCPSYGNDGQWQALVDGGDVLGVVVGHDHVNNFVADVDGVDLIQTPGVTNHSYYNDMLQGARIIEIDENDTSTYETYNVTTSELAVKDGSHIADSGERSLFNYKISMFFSKILEFILNYIRNL